MEPTGRVSDKTRWASDLRQWRYKLPPAFSSGGTPTAPFEAVVFNQDLLHRPFRPPDCATEVRALSTLIRKLADSPETILQALVEEMLELFKADSAGISLLTTEGKEERFYWPAIAGAWKDFVGGGTPRNFGPCGDVIDRNQSCLFRDLERRYDYYEAALPRVEECLLVPFYIESVPVGTVWIVAHSKERQFDSEDLRQLESIARFAATAHRTVKMLQDLQRKSATLATAEAALQQRVAELEAIEGQLSEANTDLSHFAFAAGHDLHEPLRTIKIYSQLLLKRSAAKLGPEDQLWIHSITDASSRMDALLTDLLAYAQAAHTDRDRDEIVDFNAVFDRAVSNLQTAIAESKAVVTRDDLPRLRGHAAHFIQLLQNLLINAIKYRSSQPPEIHLAVQREDGLCHFVLSDNGVGIHPENLASVFEPFKRMHSREIAGTGLGLAICRRIVQRFHGEIWAESKPGEGSRFHFTVPDDGARGFEPPASWSRTR